MFFVFVFVCLFSCVFCFGALGTSLGEGQTSDAHSHPIPWVGCGGVLPFRLCCGTEKPCGALSGTEKTASCLSKALDKCVFAFCKMGSGVGGGLLFFLIEFPAAATQPVGTRPIPLPLPSPRRGTHLGAFWCLCSPSGCRHWPSKRAAPPTCEQRGTQQSRPAQSCSFQVRPLPREAFALKVISINKPMSAWFVSCLGFVW